MLARPGRPSSFCKAQSTPESWPADAMLKGLAIRYMLRSLATCQRLPWSLPAPRAMLVCSLRGTAAGGHSSLTHTAQTTIHSMQLLKRTLEVKCTAQGSVESPQHLATPVEAVCYI